MNILAIDYGEKKMGIALSTSPIAEPYQVIKFEEEDGVIDKITEIASNEKIEQLVIGISEGKMAQKAREFGERLGQKVGIPIHFQDETLTTKEAQRLSMKAGVRRKKRKEMEDAYSAALILQSYLDSI